MTTKWEVTAALKTSSLPSPARHVMLWLIDSADKETCRIPAEFSPSLTTLAGWSGISRASVAEQLNLLEHFKWVRRDRPTVEAARSKKARTRYRVAIGKDASRDEIKEWREAQKPKKASPPGGLVQEADQSTSPPGGLENPVASPGGGLELVQELDQASPGGGLELVQELDTIPPPPFTPHSPPVAHRSGALRDEGERDGEPGLFDDAVIPRKLENTGQRINRLTKVYTDRLPLSTWNAVQAVVRAAVNTGDYSDDQITAGLNQLADEPGRPVTKNTLRIAIEGPPARQPVYAGPTSDTHSRDYSGGII